MKPPNRRVGKAPLPPDVLEPSKLPAEGAASAGAMARIATLARVIAGVVLVVSISSGVAWGARRYVKTTRRFAVTDVIVTGQTHRKAEEIAAEAQIARGANIFSVDLDEAKGRLLGDPWLVDVALARRLPGTVLVQVTEREAGAIVALGETFLAARDGEIFKRLEAGDPVDLPIVTGLGPEGVAEDREASRRTIRRAIDLAADYEHGPLAQRAALQEVHVAADGSFTIVVGKSGLALNLGDPPFRRKIDQAARVFAELEKRGSKAEAIMLDNDARPDRVVVRMR